MNEIIDSFNPKIKKVLYYTHISNREDLEQELKFTIIKYIKKATPQDTPGLFEYIESRLEY